MILHQKLKSFLAIHITMSDSDSAFKEDDRNEDQNSQKILSDNNAELEPVKLNDHRARGIIDVFAKNLKRVLSKEFLENKITEWVGILPKLLNNTIPHHTHY
jgi:hypothetical protein